MVLDEEEKAMLNGDLGKPRQWAMEHMIRVARFFDAEELVSVAQVHMMADTESLGEEGVLFFEKMACFNKPDRWVKVPMITDPRGIDLRHYRKLKQTDKMADLERRAMKAFEALGILLTDTCINYQTIMPPIRGETRFIFTLLLSILLGLKFGFLYHRSRYSLILSSLMSGDIPCSCSILICRSFL